jgi:hypothetical protein
LIPPLTIRATSSIQVPMCASIAEVSLSASTWSAHSSTDSTPRTV